MWHAKTGEYCPEEGSINEVVRFGKADKTNMERNSFLPRQLFRVIGLLKLYTRLSSVSSMAGYYLL